MGTITMNISLNEELKAFVDERVKTRGYSSHSEYMRDLVRRDEQAAATDRLKGLLLAGLESGPGEDWSTQQNRLRQRAHG